jgi:hypothetical protein
MGLDLNPAAERMELAEQLTGIRAELRRRRWAASGNEWVEERLGEHAWSKQREVIDSVRDHRRTAVHSCHEAGKSFIASRIAGWWLDIHKPGEAFVVTSATTGDQVKAILWREIGRMHTKGALVGRVNQSEWYMPVVQPNGRSKEELVAVGRKPSEYNPTAFQGIHARYVLVIFDEAAGIPGGSTDNPHSLWESADSLIANDDSRMLVIGNPDDPTSEFADVCSPGSGWNVIGIDAFETPNFTNEPVPDLIRPLLIGKTWQEEKLKKWGENNPLYISKVRGQFPEATTHGLIPIAWVRAAQARTLEPEGANLLGVDVGAGGDKNTVAQKVGNVVRIIRRDQEPDTMRSCGNLIHDINMTGAEQARVDYIGIGRGLVDRALEQNVDQVIGVNVGLPGKKTKEYENVRAEGYWHLRELFGSGEIDIDEGDDDLAAQLVALKFDRSSRGKIMVESKKEMKRRNMPSPDDADAVMLVCLPDELTGPQPVREVEVLWG